MALTEEEKKALAEKRKAAAQAAKQKALQEQNKSFEKSVETGDGSTSQLPKNTNMYPAVKEGAKLVKDVITTNKVLNPDPPRVGSVAPEYTQQVNSTAEAFGNMAERNKEQGRELTQRTPFHQKTIGEFGKENRRVPGVLESMGPEEIAKLQALPNGNEYIKQLAIQDAQRLEAQPAGKTGYVRPHTPGAPVEQPQIMTPSPVQEEKKPEIVRPPVETPVAPRAEAEGSAAEEFMGAVDAEIAKESTPDAIINLPLQNQGNRLTDRELDEIDRILDEQDQEKAAAAEKERRDKSIFRTKGAFSMDQENLSGLQQVQAALAQNNILSGTNAPPRDESGRIFNPTTGRFSDASAQEAREIGAGMFAKRALRGESKKAEQEAAERARKFFDRTNAGRTKKRETREERLHRQVLEVVDAKNRPAMLQAQAAMKEAEAKGEDVENKAELGNRELTLGERKLGHIIEDAAASRTLAITLEKIKQGGLNDRVVTQLDGEMDQLELQLASNEEIADKKYEHELLKTDNLKREDAEDLREKVVGGSIDKVIATISESYSSSLLEQNGIKEKKFKQWLRKNKQGPEHNDEFRDDIGDLIVELTGPHSKNKANVSNAVGLYYNYLVKQYLADQK